jgi:hypothetical protein
VPITESAQVYKEQRTHKDMPKNAYKLIIIVIYSATADAATTATVGTTTNSIEFRMFVHSNLPMRGKH